MKPPKFYITKVNIINDNIKELEIKWPIISTMLIKDIDKVFNNGSFLIYIYWYIILNYKIQYQVIIKIF